MKVGIWDIETAPMVCATWTLYPDSIQHDSILEDWYIICGAWKWAGQKRIHTASLLDDPARFKANHKDDYYVVKRLHEFLSEADVIVAHNGDRFDLKKANARFLLHGLPPIPKIPAVDTLKVARGEFRLSSNRLDYIGQHLGLGKKLENPKGLWIKALLGDEKAIAQMVRYNRQDVVLLEAVYDRLRPYMKNHPNLNHFNTGHVCPNCGSGQLEKRGFQMTRTVKRQRYQCKECGAWSTDGKAAEKVEIR